MESHQSQHLEPGQSHLQMPRLHRPPRTDDRDPEGQASAGAGALFVLCCAREYQCGMAIGRIQSKGLNSINKIWL